MPRPYISRELRRLVADRADYSCEYYLIHEQDTAFGCAIDHTISLKHGGTSTQENLVYACVVYNRYKESDVGSILLQTQDFIRFFNPRRDRWHEHFQLNNALLELTSSIGEVTARILGFNHDDRLEERQMLINFGRYPRPEALRRIYGNNNYRSANFSTNEQAAND